MPRRVSLPGAAELFRPTRDVDPAAGEPSEDRAYVDHAPVESPRSVPGTPTDPAGPAGPSGPTAPEQIGRAGSGRVRHDEKITVYVSADELLALERARLTLRAEHGTAVDRGRIVREALALALADLDARGAASDLVHRLGPA